MHQEPVFVEERDVWSDHKGDFASQVLSLLWDEEGGILCCIGCMAGFVA